MSNGNLGALDPGSIRTEDFGDLKPPMTGSGYGPMSAAQSKWRPLSADTLPAAHQKILDQNAFARQKLLRIGLWILLILLAAWLWSN